MVEEVFHVEKRVYKSQKARSVGWSREYRGSILEEKLAGA